MKLLLVIVLALFTPHSFAASLHCTFNPKDCMLMQGELMPFRDVESIVNDCERLMRLNQGQIAMTTSWVNIMKISSGDTNHPLMDAHLAYQHLHESKLKFDRSVNISSRYPHVRLACQQALSDYYR